MDKIIIRKAKSEDIEKIANIKVRCWQIAYRNIIADEYLDNMDIEYTIEKNKRIFCGYDGNCFCHKTGWNFDRCDRSAFRRDHRDADLTAQKCKIWLW